MKFNKDAFTSTNDRRYRNWDGYSLVYSYDFIQSIKPYIDLENIETIFDIGSRDGCQSLEFADWFPQATIHLFEPVPKSFEYCKNYTSDRKNILSNNLALGSFSGDSVFYEVINGNVGASSLLKVNDDYKHFWQMEIPVVVKTAKDYIEENNIKSVDLLWVDVQGAEIDCFKGFGEHISNVKAIHTEVGLKAFYENGSDYTNLVNYMNDNGFSSIKTISNEAGLEVDVIFVNKKYFNE